MDRLLNFRFLLPGVVICAVLGLVLPTTLALCLAAVAQAGFATSTILGLRRYLASTKVTGNPRTGAYCLGLMSSATIASVFMLVDAAINGGVTTAGVALGLVQPVLMLNGIIQHLRVRRPHDYSEGLLDLFSALGAVALIRWQWLVFDDASTKTIVLNLAPFLVLFFLGIQVGHNKRLADEPGQNSRMLKLMGVGAFTYIASIVVSRGYSVPNEPAMALVLASGFIAIAATTHSSFLKQFDPEPAGVLEPSIMQTIGPVAALLTTPALFVLFIVRHQVPTTPIGIAAIAMTGLALWRGNRLVRDREAARRASEVDKRFRALVENSRDTIVLVGEDEIVKFASGMVKESLGHTAEELVGCHISAFLDAADVAAFGQSKLYLPDGETHLVDQDVMIRLEDGTHRWQTVSVTNHINTPGIEAFVINAHDITDRKTAEEALSRMAHYDNLTGLPNRTHLLNRLEEELREERDVETGKHRNLAVLFCDLNGFKAVNDTLGHKMGDDVLRQVSGRWSAVLRGSDSIGRWGGDEFVVICPSAGNIEDVSLVAQRLTEALQTPLSIDGKPVTIGVSIGMVVHQAGETADALIHRADEAMYQSKRRNLDRTRG